MILYGSVILAILTTSRTTGAYQKKSCRDFLNGYSDVKSGEYEVYNKLGEKFTVFCEFRGSSGYMFIRHDTRSRIFLSDLNPSSPSQVIVRHLRTNTKQYDTMLSQISQHSNVPLNIQYNQSIGYNPPINRAVMEPYLFLGFLPKTISASRSVQGYRANGRDVTFTNCDANPNSYLTFYFLYGPKEPVGYYRSCCYTNLMRQWINGAVPAQSYLPWNYFFPFEMHMGGCGGYAVNGYNTLQDIVGASLGIPFCK